MTYEDDERMRRFLEALEYMRAREEDELIAQAEATLAAQPMATDVPAPNTAHPGLAECASFVLTVDPRRGHLRIPRPRPMTAFMASESPEVMEVALDVTILTAKKLAGPAPVVGRVEGDAAMYVWWAWVDDLGRHIATDAELVWR